MKDKLFPEEHFMNLGSLDNVLFIHEKGFEFVIENGYITDMVRIKKDEANAEMTA